MDVTLGLSGNTPAGDGGGGGGGGVPSGGSTTGRSSILTVSQEENNKNTAAMVMSTTTEVTSSSYSYPILDDNLDHLELGLGLSIGGGGGGGLKSKTVVAPAAAAVAGPCWSEYARILTAKDFHTNSSSSSSSVGTKRTATDSVSPPNGVVGWPPVSKAHRMPSLANQTKSPTEELAEQNKNKNRINGGGKDYCNERKGISVKKYRSVKVNMDGTLIGRKIDLNAYNSYETLAQILEEMFWGRRSSGEATGSSRLLDGNSEFVLTYQDKDGDCMLVGDVPWRMFLSSVKRLRIMRNSESNELSRKQRSKPN